MVGCACTGIMGASKGGVELDPSHAHKREGVSVLLGRMPGCAVRAFAAAQVRPPARACARVRTLASAH